MFPGLENDYNVSQASPDQVLFKSGRIYEHKIIRINYTMYDVRRGQDTFNPNSDHRDIMVLARGSIEGSETPHHFRYARIIGIFHANVQYVGPGAKDYNTRRLDFLHIRWFELVPSDPQLGELALDMLRFVPMSNRDAFGFLDPAEVLRGCHIIPAFAKGRLHPDSNTSSSYMVKDSDDWRNYYVNRYSVYYIRVVSLYIDATAGRFVDRDMLMRFQWGFGVGHAYSHLRDPQVDKVESTQDCSHIAASPADYLPAISGTSRSPIDEFDDLEDNFSISGLDWELPEKDYCEAENGSSDMDETMDDTYPPSPDEFNDLDPCLSLADLDALTWEMSEDEDDGSGGGSDQDTDASEMYEMYGSDRGDGDL